MASQSQGIQQLLQAEKRAAEKVTEARKREYKRRPAGRRAARCWAAVFGSEPNPVPGSGALRPGARWVWLDPLGPISGLLQVAAAELCDKTSRFNLIISCAVSTGTFYRTGAGL